MIIPPNRLTKGEKLTALLYLPVHLLLLPMAVAAAFGKRGMDEGTMNFLVYAVGAVFLLAALGRMFRRDFDPLCDHLGTVIFQVLGCYLITMGVNTLLSLLLMQITGEMNPNNEAVAAVTAQNTGAMTATAVFLAPIVEETMFRAGVFGTLRDKNRVAAYAVSMVSFALFHVLGYALENPIYLLYLLQYLPVSYLLCRCYEESGTIWTPIFLHMLINAVSMGAMEALT